MNAPKTIIKSYLELAGQRGAEPSVAAVVAHADVTGEEFAKHFTGLEAVVLLALEEMLWMVQGSNMPRRLDEGNPGPEAARSICDDIVLRVTDAWLPMRVGIRNHRPVVQFVLGQAVQHRAAAYFAAFPGFRLLDQRFLDSSAEYVAHGLAAIVAAWVAGELSSEPSVIAEHMTRLLPVWLADPKTIEAADPT
jgi:hypothetical protein